MSTSDAGGFIYGMQLSVNEDGGIIVTHRFHCQLGDQRTAGVPKRVKKLCFIPNFMEPKSSGSDAFWFASVDGAGILMIWEWGRELEDDSLPLLTPSLSIDTQARVTAMTCSITDNGSSVPRQTRTQLGVERTAEVKRKIICRGTVPKHRSSQINHRLLMKLSNRRWICQKHRLQKKKKNVFLAQ